MVVRKHDVAAWERRHPWIVALIAAQAAVLTVFTAISPTSSIWVLVPALTVAGAAVANSLPHTARPVVASLSAIALLTQAVYAVALFGGSARGNVLMLAVLCVIALYEVGWVLGATFVIATGAVAVLGAIDPALLDLPVGDPGRAWTTILTGAIATAVGTLALATMWRDHQRLRHVAEQQRRATEAYLEVAGSLMFVMDRHGIVTTANRHTCLTLDREEDEVVGQEWFALALPEEYRDEARRLYHLSYDAYRDTGRVSYEPMDYENEVESRDGARRQVVWWATMIADRSGAPIGMVCSGTDVTEQRAAHAALERSGVELEALRRLAQKVASLDDSRQAVVDATLALTGATAAVIFEPDRTQSELVVTTATNPDLVGNKVQLGREPAVVASAFLSGQPHFIADCEASPGINQRMVKLLGAASLMHQPIMGGHGTVGVLTVVWGQRVASLQERKVELVGLIAHESAISLRRRESLAQLERAALVDPLTGVANRRAFDAELPLALRRASNGNYPLGLVVLDLNEFKAVNDEFGHEAGDELLIRAASAWADVLRAGDLLARLGGDEFAVLLPSCEETEMALIISRLKRSTPHQPGSSMGGAMWDGTESPSSLIRRADRAQYADKAAMKSSGDDGHDPSTPPIPGPTPARIAHPRPRKEDPRGGESAT